MCSLEYFLLRTCACSIFCGIVLNLSKGSAVHEVLRVCCVFFMIIALLSTDFSRFKLSTADLHADYSAVVRAVESGTEQLNKQLEEAEKMYGEKE